MRWIASVLIVLAVVIGLWWMQQRQQPELMPPQEPTAPAEPQKPEPRYPLPERDTTPAPETGQPQEAAEQLPAEAPAEPALPDLADSDAAALEALAGLAGSDLVQNWVKPEFVVPRSVALVNSLDGSAPALKSRPLQPLSSEPRTETLDDETLLWTQANARRYDDPITTLKSIDPEKAAALYQRYHPLFQQAWEEMGESGAWFNDRLVDIIDHLLATPEVALPFALVPHEGRLHFADDALQEQSWGRKLLMRMGPEHAATVKQWLRAFRREIVAGDPATAPTG